jgi:hypothetical protein
MEQSRGFDRSQLCSDEGPPIGAVAVEPWAEEAFRDYRVDAKMELRPMETSSWRALP